MQMAATDDRHFNYFPLLSGTDYPVQPTSYIETFFRRHNGTEFINLVQMPNEAAGKPISRLTTYTHNPDDLWAAKAWRGVLVKTGFIPRERNYKAHLYGLTPYAGSMWWALWRGIQRRRREPDKRE